MKWIVENIIALITLILAIIGGGFAFVQWKKSLNLQRANFIEQIIKKLRFDKDMIEALYMVDYDQDWYDKNFHGGSEKESLIDKLLSYLTYICYLLETNNISKEESKILLYELNRTCNCWSIRAYLWNIWCFSKEQKTICTFQYLIDYGLKHQLLDKDNFTENCDKYPKYIGEPRDSLAAYYRKKLKQTKY